MAAMKTSQPATVIMPPSVFAPDAAITMPMHDAIAAAKIALASSPKSNAQSPFFTPIARTSPSPEIAHVALEAALGGDFGRCV